MKKFTILCIIQLFFLYNLVEAQCSLTASIASQTNVSCNGGSNGQLLVSVSGGTSPYTYLWSNAAGTAGIVGLSAGTFTVSISDANSCTVSISATITEPAALSSPTITAGGSTTICPGSTVDLSITPVSDVSYCWSEGGAPTQNWQAVGNAGFTSSYVDDPSLAFDPVSGDPFIAFRDVGSSNKATVMKFNGSSWEVVGSAGFSAGSALYTSLSFDPLNGIPYVAYRDGGNSSKATVMKYDGSSWVTVGSSGFSAGEAGDISFAFDPVNGAPFIAYSDEGNSDEATVMKFNGSNWVTVGIAGFSAGDARYTSLAFDPVSGHPHVAYKDFANSNKATVMKFNGSNWVTVGVAGFSAGDSRYTSLAFDPVSGNAHVAYMDGGNSSKVTVMKFNGSSWEVVGSAGFTAGYTNYTDLAFDPVSGTPYIVYGKVEEGDIVTVMKYDGSNWVIVGGAGFLNGSYNASLAFDPVSGVPFIARDDGANSSKATVMKFGNECLGETSTFAVTEAGTYEIQIIAEGGCSVNSSNQISVDLAPAISTSIISQNNISCNGGSDGSATVAVSGGTTAYTYAWSSGGTTATESNLSAGTYTVTVTDANGCSSITSATITEPTILSTSITSQTNVSCIVGSYGSATVTVSGGTTPYTYAWSSGGTTATESNLSAGIYTVTVADSNGCTATTTATNAEVNASIASQADVTCNGGSNGQLLVSVSGGTSPYTYLWSNAAATAGIVGLSAGTFTVSISDANSCTVSISATITEPAALSSPTITAGGSSTICPGSTVDLSITPVSDVSYCWSEGGAPTQIWQEVGSTGFSAGGAKYTSLAIDPLTGTPYVAYQDDGNSEKATVMKFNGSSWVTVGSAGFSTDKVEFTSLAFDPLTGTPYVAYRDHGNSLKATVMKFDGSSWVTVGSAGFSAGVAYQTSLSFDPVSVNPYVAYVDVGNSDKATVMKFDGSSWVTVGSSGFSAGGAWYNSMAFDPLTGTPYVAYADDGNSNKVTVMKFDGSSWVVVGSAGFSAGFSQFTSLSFDPLTGTPYVAYTDGGNSYKATVMKFDGSSWVSVGSAGFSTDIAWSTSLAIDPLTGTPHVAYVDVGNSQKATVMKFDGSSWVTVGSTGFSAGDARYTSLSFDPLSGNPSVAYRDGYNSDKATVMKFGADCLGDGSTYTASASGTYEVQLTAAGGCSISSSNQLAVTVYNVLVAGTASADQTICYNTTPTVLSVTDPTEEIGPYTHKWQQSTDNNTFTDIASSTTSSYQPGALTQTTYYRVIQGSAVNCDPDTTNTITIVVHNELSSGITSQTSVSCNGGSGGSAMVTVSGGTSPYTYVWSSGGTTATESSLSAGNYTVTVTDASGCTTATSVTFSEPTALSTNISTTDPSCIGASDGSITIFTAGGTEPYTYAWNTGATAAGITGLSAGTYTVTISDANGCLYQTSPTLNDPPAVTVSSVSSTNPSCNGGSDGSILITAGGGDDGPYQYSINNGVSFHSSSSFTGLSAATYTIVVQDASGCPGTGTTTLLEPSILSLSITSQTNVDCFGNTTGSATAATSGGTSGYTYAWNTGETNATETGLDAGTYTLTVTDANGCTATTTATITEPDLLTHVTTALQNVSCNGGSDGAIVSIASQGTSPYSYIWSNGGTSSTVTDVAAGTHSVTITDANGCTFETEAIVIEPAPLPASISVDAHVSCNGFADGMATASATGGTSPYTYLWSNSATTESVSGVIAGTYSVSIIDANGCVSTSSATITEPTTLSVASVVDDNVSCNGFADGGASASASGGTSAYTYLWSNGVATASITGVVAGTYTVTTTDANGCTATSSCTITEPTTLVAASVVDANISCNGLSDGGATASATGGTGPYSFVWSNSATTESITGVAAATYTVTVTDAHGCTSGSSVTITEPVVLSASISSQSNVSCHGGSDGSATATASGGTSAYSYLWSTGATTATVPTISAGTYTVTITDANSCIATSTTTITEPASLSASISIDAHVSCNGFADGMATASATGGTSPYTYLWSNSATTESVSGVIAGTYSVTITDANGCVSMSSATITEPTTLSVASAVDDHVSCNGSADGGASASASGGTSAYTYLWSNGVATASITGVVAGTYTVTATDANGCTVTSSSTITQPTTLVASTQMDAEVSCTGLFDGGATASATGGTSPYTYAWNNGATTESITGVAAATYTVTVTDAHGCTSGSSVSISTIVDITDPVIVGCPDDIVVSNDAGLCSAVVSWLEPCATDNCDLISFSTDHAMGSSFNKGTTTVTYTATDATGNTATCSFTVTVNDTEDPTISCNANIIVSNNAGICGAVVSYTAPIGTDNCSGAVTTQTSGLGSGSTFPVGTTTEEYTVTDAAGNTATCSFTVTIDDTENPVITCPADITVSNDAGTCGATISYTSPIGTDNCSGAITNQISGQNGGTTFPIGTTVNTFVVTDAAGNTATCSFTVTVNDTENPTIDCPADITVFNENGTCGQIVSYTLPIGQDNCLGSATAQTDGLGSGATFPVGTTTEEYTVTDASGNTAVCSFTVTVLDNENPVISCPANITVNNDAGFCGAVISYTAPTGTDNCSGAVTTQTSGLGSGSTFPVGTTTEEYTVTDAAGNTATCSFTVTVDDTEDPVITCPANITVNNDAGICGAVVSYTPPSGTDNCQGSVTTQTSGLGSGSTFPVGTTTEEYTVTDAAGNTAMCSFTVTVNDTEDPVISCPSDITVSNDAGTCGATISYTSPIGTDNCPGAITNQISGQIGGTTFPVGTTVNTFVVTDAAGNTAMCSFTITVNDTEYPTITCPGDTLICVGPYETEVAYSYVIPTSDNCPGESLTQTSGLASASMFPLGTTTNSFTVTDASGNSVSCSFNVKVVAADAAIVVSEPHYCIDEQISLAAMPATERCETGCELNAYCASFSNLGYIQYITEVKLAGVSNWSSSSSYSNYTGSVMKEVKIDSVYAFSVTVTSSQSTTHHTSVFIDWNRDGDFDDADENSYLGSGSGTMTLSSSITIPAGAAVGKTMMRIVTGQNTVPSACGNYPTGETEDYEIEFIGWDVNEIVAYAWSGSNGWSSASAQNTFALAQLSHSGSYELITENTQGCMDTAWYELEVHDPQLSLPDTIVTMYADTIWLDLGTFDTYYWNTGSTLNPFAVPDYGTYYVRVSENGCLAYDTVVIAERQDIFMPHGWSTFSTYIDIHDDMTLVLETLEPDFVMVKDGNGNVYWPFIGINTIGNITPGQAYQIRTFQDLWLIIEGSAVVPGAVPTALYTNYNLIGYLRRAPAPIADMTSSIQNDLIIVLNDDGKIYWPALNINQIGDMLPGEGYKMKMAANSTLIYPNNGISFNKGASYYSEPMQYRNNLITSSNMVVAIPNAAWMTAPQLGDEIGAFSSSGQLVGTGVYEGDKVVVTIWGDDEIDKGKAMLVSQLIEFRLWSQQTGEEQVLYISDWLEGDGTYREHSIAIAAKIGLDGSELENSLSVFPNPVRSTASLDYQLREDGIISISLYNSVGEKIREIYKVYSMHGAYNEQIDLSDVEAGVYYIRLITENDKCIEKITKL